MSTHRIKSGAQPTPVRTPERARPPRSEKKTPAAPREIDVARATSTVAAPEFAGFTPLPSLELGELHANAKVEKASIRTWKFTDGRATEVALTQSRASLPPATEYRAVTNRQLNAAVKQGHEVRAQELKAGTRPPAALVTPEDGSVKVKAFHMAVLGEDATGFEYPMQMAEVGRAEGFRVVIRVDSTQKDALAEALKKEGLEDFATLIPIEVKNNWGQDALDFWSEDQGELHVDGSVSVPRTLKQPDGIGEPEAWKAILRARVERLHPHAKFAPTTDAEWSAALKKFPDLGFGAVGATSYRGGQRAIAALAVGEHHKVRVSNGYLEGGNSLVGRRADGTGFAVVGKDSMAVSRAALEKDLGRTVSDTELRQRIADDFGISPDQLIEVEQPGDFHLDMHVMLLPGANVVVNDPLEAWKLQSAWLKADLAAREPQPPPAGASQARRDAYENDLDEWKYDRSELPGELRDLKAAAEKNAKFEARVANQLEASGLTVHRMAGVFPQTSFSGPMNFLNGEAAKNAAGDGFYVALGGDARAEAYVVQKLAGEIPSGLSAIHFLDRRATGYTLNAKGGLSCRSKLEGDFG